VPIHPQTSVDIPKPLRIVLLLQDLEFGGTQRYATHLLRHLDRDLFAPELWMLRGGVDMIEQAEATGVPLRWMSRSSWVPPRALANLAWHLAVYRPHLLYTLTVVPNIWGRLFGALSRVPVIVASWRSLFPKQYERLLWRLTSRTICNAHVLKEIMVERHGVDPSRVAVIPNPVDADLFTPDHDKKAAEPTVVSVGRLVREKDPLTLVEGFRLIAARVPGARFDIIGDGHLKGDVTAALRRYALERTVSLLPGRPDIRPDLRRAWVFVLASVREASPNVILEAMSSELPIVASAVGGIPELVRHGENGFLFEPGDAQGLAERLGSLLVDAPLRRRMGENGRSQVLQHHTMDHMVKETERVFLEAAHEAASAGHLRA